MNRQQVEAIFLLAGLDVQFITEAENPYWGYVSDKPQWLVHLKDNWVIKIHHRKSVIHIEWDDPRLVFPLKDQYGREEVTYDEHLTSDNVTKGPNYIHAGTFGKCVDYLIQFMPRVERAAYLRDYMERALLGKLTDNEISYARLIKEGQRKKAQRAKDSV